MSAPLNFATVCLQCHKFTKIKLLGASTQMVQTVRGRKFKPEMTTKRYGWLQGDGCFVFKGDVLVKQSSLKDYPGENVGITAGNSLIALCDGKVVVTGEKLSPYPNSPLYERVKNGVEIYKRFYNIYPVPVHGKFKLTSLT